MKYRSCKYIQGGITFRPDGITICNKLWGAKRYEQVNLSYEENFYEKFKELRNNLIKNCIDGILPHDGCSACLYLEDKEWDDEPKYTDIEISHWLHCNAACCYCSSLPQTKGKMDKYFKKNSPSVQLFPVIKRLIKEDMIHPQANICITGGELAMLKEFPSIMKLFLNQKDSNYSFYFQTNGIKYEPLLSKALNKGIGTLIIISLDAGTREMYKLMKKRDKYHTVLNNLARYIRDAKDDRKNRVVSKYIIVPNVNDNKEEIDKWIADCKRIGLKTLHPSMEFCSYVQKPHDYIEKQGELYQYMKEKIVENGFEMITYDFLEEIVKNKGFQLTKN